jgi:hypothetical protein
VPSESRRCEELVAGRGGTPHLFRELAALGNAHALAGGTARAANSLDRTHHVLTAHDAAKDDVLAAAAHSDVQALALNSMACSRAVVRVLVRKQGRSVTRTSRRRQTSGRRIAAGVCAGAGSSPCAIGLLEVWRLRRGQEELRAVGVAPGIRH